MRKTDKKGNDEIATAVTTINYYEAAMIAYTDREYMRKFIEREINVEEINKYFRPLWKFTYKIVSGEEKKRVKVVNKDPDNLLVQWVPGGMTITEIFKEMNKGCRSVCIPSNTYFHLCSILYNAHRNSINVYW
jgi:wyosine [tRNA(Phe)-imidazoG37] synthetase (radical SAM superfamily)